MSTNKSILHKAISITSKQLKLIWGLITILALANAIFFTYKVSNEHIYQDLVSVSKDLSKSVDGLIEDLFQEVYNLPIYGKEIQDCPAGLSNDLKHIVFNNPNISGLIVSNQHHTICSTISPSKISITPSKRIRRLVGPFELSLFDQPIFILRQKIGPYYIDVILVASILKTSLELSNSVINSIAIYNDFNNQTLLKIQRSVETHKWGLLAANAIPEPDGLVVNDKLHSIDGIALKVFANKEAVYHYILLNQILASLFTLLVCYILYILISRNLNKHYSLKRALKKGIKEKQFYPDYQPVFDTEKNKYCGVELLVRWREYGGNIMMPDSFIDEAESTGLIVPITLQIIEIAFQDFQDLLKEHSEFHLAINLTVEHFEDPFFFNKFNLLQNQYGILAYQIIFEITERRLLDTNNTQFITKMNQLRAADFSLAIDDYGTGHASISYLQSFPFNYLKIDKLFIQAIGTKAITESLNDAIIHMAKDLNLAIIAEGVETQEQVEYLEKNGIRYLQGWYFSKAVGIEKIKELIQGKKNEFSN
jgi:sensor c-di-GMP phosphodiesterase-like protein